MKSWGQISLHHEVIGGISAFFAMAFIVVVNPAILSSPGTGIAAIVTLLFLENFL